MYPSKTNLFHKAVFILGAGDQAWGLSYARHICLKVYFFDFMCLVCPCVCRLCVDAFGNLRWAAYSLELELHSCESATLHAELQTWIFWNNRKFSCLLSHLSTHSLYMWIDGKIIHNNQRSKQPRDSFTGKRMHKMWHNNATKYYAPGVQRHCVPEAKYLDETGWSLGTTLWMKFKDIMLTETQQLWDSYRIPLYEQ